MIARQKILFLLAMVLGVGIRSVFAAEEIQVVNLGSTPLPVIRISMSAADKGCAVQSADGKALASDRLDNGILVDTPLPVFSTCKLLLTGGEPSPGAGGPTWLKKMSTTFTDKEGRVILRLPGEQVVFMEALSMDCAGTIAEKTKGNLLWEIEVPDKGGLRSRFFGPAAGEIIMGNTAVVFRAKSPLTLMPRDEFSIPRNAREKDVLSPGNDWLFIGPRKGTKAGGLGLYLWCAKGKVQVTADGLLADSGATLGFQRGEFSINWYVPEAPVVLRPKTGSVGQFEGRSEIYQFTVLDRNKDGLADLNADLWWIRTEAVGSNATPGLVYAFHPGTTGKGEYLCLVKPPADFKELRNLKVQGRVPADPKNFTIIEEHDQDFAVGDLDKNAAGIKALATFWDWNASGRFLCGNLLRGGHRSEGWHMWEGDRCSRVIFDLDGDSDADVWYGFAYKMAGDMLTGGDHAFNFQGRLAAAYVRLTIDPASAKISGPPRKQSDPHFILEVSTKVDGNTGYGRFYQDSAASYDEQIIYRFDQQDEPGGGFIQSPHATCFFEIWGGGHFSMTMGRLGGGPSLGWNIELAPMAGEGPIPRTEVDQPAAFRVCEFRDRGGHFFKMCSPNLPAHWDGKPLPFKKQEQWNAADFLPNASWKQITTGRYFKLKGLTACFTQEGCYFVCNEGMYGGNISWMERVEHNYHGADFTLYYSPLFGGLHLKAADIGCQISPFSYPGKRLDPNTWFRKSDLGQTDSSGADLVYRTPEGKRYYGPVWLYYHDLNGDGYFDTYLYDVDNDGMYERGAWYDPKADSILFCQGRRFASWPEHVEFTEVSYQIENYDRIEQLYVQGFNEDPLPVRCTLASSGIPVEMKRTSRTGGIVSYEAPREVFVAAGEEWGARAAVDAYHGDVYTGTWRDFGPDGLARLGTIFHQNRVIPEFLKTPWSAVSLAGIDVLLVTRLCCLPTVEEMEALFEWVDNGGVLVLSPTVDKETRIWFKYFEDQLAFSTCEKLIASRTSIYRYANEGGYSCPDRYPSPDNRIEHYVSPVEGLLAGLNYVCFVGYTLELKGRIQPLLSYKGRPIIGCAPLGKGRIVVCSTDLLVNRYIIHPMFIEPFLCNDKLVNCLVRWLLEPVPSFDVTWKNPADDSRSFDVRGKGGLLTIRRIADNHRVEVDGKLTRVQPLGIVEEFPVPAGAHTVKIITEKGVRK